MAKTRIKKSKKSTREDEGYDDDRIPHDMFRCDSCGEVTSRDEIDETGELICNHCWMLRD